MAEKLIARSFAGGEITPENVKNLELRWVFQAQSLEKFEATPLVVDGVMYTVEAPNNIVALDAATGQAQTVADQMQMLGRAAEEIGLVHEVTNDLDGALGRVLGDTVRAQEFSVRLVAGHREHPVVFDFLDPVGRREQHRVNVVSCSSLRFCRLDFH